MSSHIGDIAVIGGGVAGVSAVQSLRSEGYDGRLFLIGKERWFPYDRTTLSKAVLAGDLVDPPLLLPKDFYDESQVEVVLDKAVVQLDISLREVLLDGGRSLKVDRVLLATGANPRVPFFRGSGLDGVTTLRTSDDAHRLHRDWKPGQRVVIVGGGLIGCEIATTARKLGLQVTILEAADELLQRVLGRGIGGWCRARLEELGVVVRLNSGAAEFQGTDRLVGVIDTGGRHFPADIAVVCVGAQPETAVAEKAGL